MQRHTLALAVTATLFAGCESNDPRLSTDMVYLGGRRVPVGHGYENERSQRMNFDTVSHWDGDGISGSPRIKISLGEQKAFFYKGDQLVGISLISTGREGFGTPSGSFRITQKHADHVSSRYGDYVDAQTGEVVMKDIDRQLDPMPKGARYDGAKMPYFMRIHGGVGMHAGFLPGYPASHGCIRMPSFMAEAFFRNVSNGTPVTVTH